MDPSIIYAQRKPSFPLKELPPKIDFGKDQSGIIQSEVKYGITFSNLILAATTKTRAKSYNVAYKPFYICISREQLDPFPNFKNLEVSLIINETVRVIFEGCFVDNHLEHFIIIRVLPQKISVRDKNEGHIFNPTFNLNNKTENLRFIRVTFNNMGFMLDLNVICMSFVGFTNLFNRKPIEEKTEDYKYLHNYLLNEIGEISKKFLVTQIPLKPLGFTTINLTKPRLPLTPSYPIQQPPLKRLPDQLYIGKRKAETVLEGNKPAKKPRVCPPVTHPSMNDEHEDVALPSFHQMLGLEK